MGLNFIIQIFCSKLFCNTIKNKNSTAVLYAISSALHLVFVLVKEIIKLSNFKAFINVEVVDSVNVKCLCCFNWLEKVGTKFLEKGEIFLLIIKKEVDC